MYSCKGNKGKFGDKARKSEWRRVSVVKHTEKMEEGTPPPLNEVEDIEPKNTIDNNDQTPERSPENKRKFKRDSRDNNRDFTGYKRDFEDRGWRRDQSPPMKRQRKGDREWCTYIFL